MNLKSYREKNKITQMYLASQLGVSRSNISKWESGKSKPRAAMLIKLSQILDCTMEELLGIEKTPKTEETPTGSQA